MHMRHSQHRRQLELHCPGQPSGDVARPLFEAMNIEKYFFVCAKRNLENVFVARMQAKRSETVSPVPCSREGRQIVGSLIHAARCTSMDLSQPLSRLGRYLDKRNDWAEKELNIVGYVRQTVAYNLTFITHGNDVWEDVKKSSSATRTFLLLTVMMDT